MPAAMLDLRNRARLFARLEEQVFDVIVVGGGITGAGIVRDAALRGLSVCLIEARDFASGTSSKSSKLVHGGLRYLAQGDLGVVREAAQERKTLRRIAPHLAQTNAMIVPAKSQAGLAKLRAGLWTYEKLGEVAKDERYEVWDRKRLSAEEPALESSGLAGAIVYPEYLTDDARLVIANIRDAAGAGALALNYTAVEEILSEGGRAVGVKVRSTLGTQPARAIVRGRIIVNAAGPWVDFVRTLEEPGAEARLQLTQGIHLVFDRARLPLKHTLIMTAADRRSLFAIPRGEFAYVGTTDTFYPEADYWPSVAGSDIDYLLDATNAACSVAPLSRGDIISHWAGLRPLIAQKGKSPSEISRKDEVFDGPLGTLAMAGGKLTAYRRMAERIVDLCAERLARTLRPCETAQRPLPGGDFAGGIEALIRALEERQTAPAEAERLARLYGAEAHAILDAGGGIAAEARHAVLGEGAVTLEDYWVRRSARAWFSKDAGLSAIEPAAHAMAGLLGWSDAATAEEIRICRSRAEADAKLIRTGMKETV